MNLTLLEHRPGQAQSQPSALRQANFVDACRAAAALAQARPRLKIGLPAHCAGVGLSGTTLAAL